MFYYLLFLSMFIRAQQYFLFLILLSGLSVSLFVSWLLHIHYCDFFRSPMLLCTLIIWRHLGHILSVPFFSPSTNHLLLFLCAFEWCPRKILFKCVISSCKWEVNFFHILCSSSSASYVLSHSFSLFSSQILLLPSSISRLSFSVASTLRCVCRNLDSIYFCRCWVGFFHVAIVVQAHSLSLFTLWTHHEFCVCCVKQWTPCKIKIDNRYEFRVSDFMQNKVKIESFFFFAVYSCCVCNPHVFYYCFKEFRQLSAQNIYKNKYLGQS